MAGFLASYMANDEGLLNRHPRVTASPLSRGGAARLRGVSKDGRKHRPRGHPSRLALKKGEHLRMTAMLPECADDISVMGRMPQPRVSLAAVRETFRMNCRRFFRLAPVLAISLALISAGARAQSP